MADSSALSKLAHQMFDAYGRGDLDGMMRVRNAAKLWMVEARPAYSDEFWSA